ncbi:baseplate J protein, partial [Butyricicoccus sp. 1XD8-22]
MIDKEILDAVLPVPELDELRDEKIAELQEAGFVISNFHSGGIFHTMLMIVLRVEIELLNLLRLVLNNLFVSHASGVWLDLKMADYSKKRKKAQKTQGLVTVSRLDADGEAIKIPRGAVFKTAQDINGDELRFFALETTVLKKGAAAVDVPVEAEAEGARWNVPQGQITRSL